MAQGVAKLDVGIDVFAQNGFKDIYDRRRSRFIVSSFSGKDDTFARTLYKRFFSNNSPITSKIIVLQGNHVSAILK